MKSISYKTYLDKIYGCFIGKAVSGNIGAPYEGIKMPMELPYSPQMINCDLPNDDLDLQVLWLDVLEQKGEHFTSYDLLDRFANHCPYSPGEYAVMRKNYSRGIDPPYSGKFCNDYYTEGMGCPIRSELWGCVSVGNIALASEFASRDGQLDHFGESIWAERFLAALESEAFFESDIHVLLDKALTVLPGDSKFRGPCTVYLSRVLVAPEDMEVCVQIGHSCPFRFTVNGALVAKRDCCDNWTGENVHVEGLRLHRGENKLVLRITRVNADAKMNVTFSREAACSEHIVTFASRNPYCF